MSGLTKSLLFFSVLAVAVGCDSSWGSSDPANFITRFGGRVLNGNTQMPLGGVTVKVCNYQATASTDSDGHWFIEIIPGIASGTYVTITFERSGYGSVGQMVGVYPDTNVLDGSLQNRHFLDMGTMSMRPGEPLTVNVTRDGSPYGNAAVVAIPDSIYYGGDGTGGCTDLNIAAKANASGVATLPNLDPTQQYNILVPAQDVDGDGQLDNWYGSSWVRIADTGSVAAVNVDHYEGSDGPSIAGTNLAWYWGYFNMPTGTVADDQGRAINQYGFADLNTRYNYLPDEYVFFSQAVVTANGSVQVVFRFPVDITGANFRWRNNLVSLADPDWNDILHIDATATPLAGSNSTIFNFTPLTPLPANEVVTLNFIARSQANPAQSSNMSMEFYVPLNLTTIPFTVDNYNGSRDGSGGSNQVYLQFDEAVEGFYKVLAYTIDTSTVTFEDPYQATFQYSSDDQIINNQAAAPATGTNIGQSGAIAGRHYTVRLRYQNGIQLSLNDDSAAQINTVKLEISVRNIRGVVLDTVVTVPVQ